MNISDNEEPTRKKTKAEMTAHERRLAKKKKLKDVFDNDYDMKGENEFHDSWKAEVNEQSEVQPLHKTVMCYHIKYCKGLFKSHITSGGWEGVGLQKCEQV